MASDVKELTVYADDIGHERVPIDRQPSRDRRTAASPLLRSPQSLIFAATSGFDLLGRGPPVSSTPTWAGTVLGSRIRINCFTAFGVQEMEPVWRAGEPQGGRANERRYPRVREAMSIEDSRLWSVARIRGPCRRGVVMPAAGESVFDSTGLWTNGWELKFERSQRFGLWPGWRLFYANAFRAGKRTIVRSSRRRGIFRNG